MLDERTMEGGRKGGRSGSFWELVVGKFFGGRREDGDDIDIDVPVTRPRKEMRYYFSG